MIIFGKIINSLRRDGIVATVIIIFNYPIILLKRGRFEKKLKSIKSIEDRFGWIHRNNYWGSDKLTTSSTYESHSGSGSTIEYTENLRRQLPKIMIDFNVKSVVDAPCGDFNWMKVLLPTLNVNYIGAEIVPDLVNSLNMKYKTESIQFINLNIISDSLPNADILICRDCLFHFSFEDIKGFLKNFTNSKISYLLITNQTTNFNFQNIDIQTGSYRSLDLFLPPFKFPTNPLARIEESTLLGQEKEMCLFSKEQIVSILN